MTSTSEDAEVVFVFDEFHGVWILIGTANGGEGRKHEQKVANYSLIF